MVQKYYIDWLERSAQSLTIPGWGETAAPALIMLATLLSLFIYIHLRTNLRYLSVFSFTLLLAIVGSFHACGSKTQPLSGMQPSGPIKPSTPPAANNLDGYFNNHPRQYMFKKKSVDSASSSQSVAEFTRPECIQYNALLGRTQQASASCRYVNHWENQGSTLGVKSILNQCRGTNKYLVMDLVTDFRNPTLYASPANSPLVSLEHGSVYFAPITCIDLTSSQPLITVMDPSLLSYEVISYPENEFSYVERDTEHAGWFKVGFIKRDANSISSRYSTIRLSAQQGDAATLPLDKLPQVRVMGLPSGYHTWDKYSNMGTILSDAPQTLPRESTFHGLVNVANGELALSTLHLAYALPSNPLSFTIAPTIRTSYQHLGDLGALGPIFPHKAYYSFEAPTGSDGTYEFLHTGEGRVFYIPRDGQPGIFWGADPCDTSAEPRDDPRKPNSSATHFFEGLDREAWDLNGRRLTVNAKGSEALVLYIYSGNQVLMMMDSIAGRENGASELAQITSTFAAAEAALLSGQFEQAATTIRNALLNKPGNFLYFLRDSKNFIRFIVDKSGNAIEYKYVGELLQKVIRRALHNPENLATNQVDSLTLWQFKYAATPAGLDPETWRALPSDIYSYLDRSTLNPDETFGGSVPMYSEISYTSPADRYSEMPVVSSYTTKSGSLTYAYDFKAGTICPQNPSTSLAGTLSTVTEPSGVYLYKSDDAGLVTKLEGPTESSDREVLLETLYDRTNLRAIDRISRGKIESITKYDSQGRPTELLKCADRQPNSNDAVASVRLASYLENGLIDASTLTCEGLSRKTLVSNIVFKDYFVDLAATPIALSMTSTSVSLPNSANTTDTITRNLAFTLDDFDSIGSNTNGQSTQTQRHISVHGIYFDLLSESQFDDGRMQSSSRLHMWTPQASAQLPSAPSNQPMASTNQTGFYTHLPSAGADTVYTPDHGDQSLSGEIQRLYDIYGNVIFEKLQDGAEIISQYDYRTPAPQLVFRQMKNLIPVTPEGTGTLGHSFYNAAELVLNFYGAGVVTDLGNPEQATSQKYLTAAHRAFNANSVVEDIFDLKPHFNEDFETSIGSSGLETTTSYDNALRPVRTSQVWVSDDPEYGGVNSFITTDINRSPDPMKRPFAVTISDNLGHRLNQTVYTYRADYDHGLEKLLVDQTSLEGGKLETSGFVYDWAGRLLSYQEKITEVETNGPTETEYRMSYSPFGEVTSKVSIAKKNGSPILTNTTLIEREPVAGIVLSTTTQIQGDRVDSSPVTERYYDFDLNLAPQTVLTEIQKSPTEILKSAVKQIGVPGKEIEDQSFISETYADSSFNPFTSEPSERRTTRWDGCGNLIETEIPTGGQQTLKSYNEIAYGIGACRLVSSTEASIDPASAWRTFYGYRSDGSVIVKDDRLHNGVDGDYGRAHVSSSFLYCDRSEGGRCQSRGARFIFSASGRQKMSLPGTNWAIDQAEWGYLSARGSPISIKKLVADKLYEETSQDAGASGGSTTLPMGSTSYSELLSTVQQSQFRAGTSAPAYQSTDTVDPVLGTLKSQSASRLNPLTNLNETTTAQHQFDSLGRNTQFTRTFNGWNHTQTVSQEPTQWERGLPKRLQMASGHSLYGQWTESLTHKTMNFDVPTSTEVTAEYKLTGGLRTKLVGLSSMTLDGHGRPKVSEYTSPSSAEYGNIGAYSKLETTVDKAGRITRYRTSLRDQPALNKVSKINFGKSVDRLMLPNVTAINVDYTYHPDGFTMQYAGFTVRYYLNQSESIANGTIKAIQVTGPAGEHWFRNSGGSFLGDPYRGQVDQGGGVQENWWSNLFNSEASHTLAVQDGGNPIHTYIRRVTNPDRTQLDTHSIDRRFRSYDLSFESSVLKKINNRWIGEIDPYSQKNVEPDWLQLKDGDVFTKRAEIQAQSENCDRLRPKDSLNSYKAAAANSVLSDDFFDYFDERKQLAWARRTHYFNFGTAREQKYRIDVRQTYNLFHRPAISEELISFADQEGLFSTTYAPLRLVQRRRWDVPAPQMGRFSSSVFTLVERVQDTRSSHPLAQELSSAPLSPATNLLHVYGPMGPVMSFYQNSAGRWIQQSYIYDQFGNVTSIRRSPNDQNIGLNPRENEIYFPYLSSIVMSYKPAVTYQSGSSNQVGEYHTQTLGANVAADGQTTYTQDYKRVPHVSFDPRFLPNTLSFAAMGAYRDMLGVHYFESTAYDSYRGQVLAPDMSRNNACEGGGSILAQARGALDDILARTQAEDAEMGPSVGHTNVLARALADFDMNYAWDQGLISDLAGVAGEAWVARQLEGSWYLSRSLGFTGSAMNGLDMFFTGNILDSEPGSAKEFFWTAMLATDIAGGADTLIGAGLKAMPRLGRAAGVASRYARSGASKLGEGIDALAKRGGSRSGHVINPFGSEDDPFDTILRTASQPGPSTVQSQQDLAVASSRLDELLRSAYTPPRPVVLDDLTRDEFVGVRRFRRGDTYITTTPEGHDIFHRSLPYDDEALYVHGAGDGLGSIRFQFDKNGVSHVSLLVGGGKQNSKVLSPFGELVDNPIPRNSGVRLRQTLSQLTPYHPEIGMFGMKNLAEFHDLMTLVRRQGFITNSDFARVSTFRALGTSGRRIEIIGNEFSGIYQSMPTATLPKGTPLPRMKDYLKAIPEFQWDAPFIEHFAF